MRVTYYQGDQIDLSTLEPGDEPVLRQWINDPRVWSTLNHRRPISEPREREWLDSYGKSAGDYSFGIVVRQQDRLIGTCGLHGVSAVNRSAELGIMIGDMAAQNQGYGSEAVRLLLRLGFIELNLNRIRLCVLSSNERAIHVYEQAGFEFEGCDRQAIYRHGRYLDLLRYAVLREQWTPSLTALRTKVPVAERCMT
jgi:[ribosomal protein S5]-alanine N-acetyltransferase